jgi:hypothetical protein
LKTAALLPTIHKEIVDHFGDAGLPADALLEQYLVWDRPEGQRFNPATVRKFIESFRETLSYAGVSSADIIEADPGDEDDGDGMGNPPPPPPPADKGKVRRTMSTGMKEDVCSLGDQFAVLQWPERLDDESKEDFVDWLDLMVKKIKRKFDIKSQSTTDSGADDPDDDE